MEVILHLFIFAAIKNVSGWKSYYICLATFTFMLTC